MEPSPEEQAAKEKEKADMALSFLQRDYELKIKYLSDHFSRMWTRFNFFLVLESGLSAALWLWFKEMGLFAQGSSALAWMGLVTSLCWYVMGAEDHYLVEAYRTQVKTIGEKISKELGLNVYLGSDYVYVGNPNIEIEKKIYQWRLKPISTTKLAALFPLLVTTYWIFVIALTYTKRCT